MIYLLFLMIYLREIYDLAFSKNMILQKYLVWFGEGFALWSTST